MNGTLEEDRVMMDVGAAGSVEESESNGVKREIRKEWQKPRLLPRDGPPLRLGGSDVGYIPPAWWFEHYDPCWAPLRTWLRQKQHLTLSEFQLVVDHMSGLTSIEKTIAVSAFLAYKNAQY